MRYGVPLPLPKTPLAFGVSASPLFGLRVAPLPFSRSLQPHLRTTSAAVALSSVAARTDQDLDRTATAAEEPVARNRLANDVSLPPGARQGVRWPRYSAVIAVTRGPCLQGGGRVRQTTGLPPAFRRRSLVARRPLRVPHPGRSASHLCDAPRLASIGPDSWPAFLASAPRLSPVGGENQIHLDRVRSSTRSRPSPPPLPHPRQPASRATRTDRQIPAETNRR